MSDTPDAPRADAPSTPLGDRPAPTSAPLGAAPGASGATGAAGPPSNGWAAPERPAAAEPAPAPAAASPVGTVEAPAPKATGRRRKAKRQRSQVRSAIEWVAVIVGALVVALVVKTFLFQAFYIPSASMEPTLKEGDRVLVNKLSYDLHDIHRGDIVVFQLPTKIDPKHPEDQWVVGADGYRDLIKRAIGLPGDTIETRDGVVYINGKKLDEPWLPKGVTTNKPPIAKTVVPKDHIFVMGDNRDNSADSRYAGRGPIPVRWVVGRAFVQVWPPGSIGGL
jgi:signal peptidase I